MIFIPQPNKSVAGPQTFLRNLTEYLSKVDYPFTFDPDKSNAILCSPIYPSEVVERIKRRGGKVIQRLDGIYYPEKHGGEFNQMNSEVEVTYKEFADFIIFQSEYSLKQCFSMIGEIEKEKYTIIVNGVNKEIFFPSKETKYLKLKKKSAIKFITTGNFRTSDMLEPIINALDKLKDEFKIEFHIAGPIADELMPLVQRKYIKLHGEKNMKQVSKLLRNSHIFLYSNLNPPCPNSVIEAISTGIPVVGLDSGAMRELLYFSAELLAEVNDKIFQSNDEIDYLKLKDKILLCINDYERFKEIALKNSNLYSFTECGDKYIEVFNNIVQ